MRIFVSVLTLLLGMVTAHAGTPVSAKNIVIVHGAFAGGSGWKDVRNILENDGYKVTLVQNSTASLAADVTATQDVLSKIADTVDSVVLVGHSYGGEVITQAGNDPKVKALVYVAAFVPDKTKAPQKEESLQSLSDRANAYRDPSVAAPTIFATPDGFLLVDPTKFIEAFAADVDHVEALTMAATQLPLGLQTFSDPVTAFAWKTKPSYYIVCTEDHMIPPAFERAMATRAGAVQTEIKSSHAVYISQPKEVANVIEKAASK